MLDFFDIEIFFGRFDVAFYRATVLFKTAPTVFYYSECLPA